MKPLSLKFASLALLGVVAFAATPAHAGNSGVETALQSSGDTSMFYQALVTTGVLNQLHENERYTVFAPTNAAFAQIQPQQYPCFYSEQCRPQIAALLRNHIVVGKYDLPELVTYGQGIQTGGNLIAHVREPYVNDFSVDNQDILSKNEVNGSIVYRINGVMATPQELSQFQAVNYVQMPADSVTTITKKTTYHTQSALPPTAYPARTMMPADGIPDDGAPHTTTVIHNYSAEQ